MRGSSSYEDLQNLQKASGTSPGTATSVERATQSDKDCQGTVEFLLYPYDPSEATKEQIKDLALEQERLDKKNGRYTSSATTSQEDFLLPLCTEDNPGGSIVHLNRHWDFDGREAIKINPGSALEVEVKLYRFVITKAGVLVCGSNEVGLKYDHSALSARWSDEPSENAVLAAGEMGFDRDGKLRFVCNKTGHFRVPAVTLERVLYPALLAHGYAIDNTVMCYGLKDSIADLYVEKFDGDRDDHDTNDIKAVGSPQLSDEELESLSHFFLEARKVALQEAAAQKAAAQAKDQSVPVRNAVQQGDTNGARGSGLFADLSSGPLIDQSSDSRGIRKREREDVTSDENHEGVTSKGRL